MKEYDKKFLLEAIEKSKQSAQKKGFPAGAVLVEDDVVIGSGISVGNVVHDPTSHGEIAAIREACLKAKTNDLSGAVLYTSLQPCAMCFAAAMWAGVGKIVYACGAERVSSEYYGGTYNISNLNEELTDPLELIHGAELETDALDIIEEWEASSE